MDHQANVEEVSGETEREEWGRKRVSVVAAKRCFADRIQQFILSYYD